MPRIGTRVGSALLIAHGYAARAPYVVLSRDDLTTYTGDERYPSYSGDQGAAAVNAFYFGGALACLAFAVASHFFPTSPALQYFAALVTMPLGALYGWTVVYRFTADQKAAAEVSSTTC